MPEKPRIPLKQILSSLPSFAVLAVFGYLVFFIWDYPQGRAFFAAWLIAFTALIILFGNQQELLRERSRPGPGVPQWDRTLVVIYRLLNAAVFIVAFLDGGKYHWSPALPLAAYVAAYALLLGGLAVSYWAMYVNRFFSSMVRIQTDRGHQVVDAGPYRWVRHPGYASTLAFMLAAPVALGSLWALIPAVMIIALLLIRTMLEDRFLHERLPGYADYARRVTSRWLPGMW